MALYRSILVVVPLHLVNNNKITETWVEILKLNATNSALAKQNIIPQRKISVVTDRSSLRTETYNQINM